MPKKAPGLRVQLYGMDHWWKLFSPRRLLALTTFSGSTGSWESMLRWVRKAIEHLPAEGAAETET